jgi:hypothetical protein
MQATDKMSQKWKAFTVGTKSSTVDVGELCSFVLPIAQNTGLRYNYLKYVTFMHLNVQDTQHTLVR